MTAPLLAVEHNERGSVSIGSTEHLRLEVVKQTREGEIVSVFVIGVEPDSKLHIIARPNPEPQEASR